MFEWKLTVKIQDCAGIIINPDYDYTIIGRLDNKFTTRTEPAQIGSNRLKFNTNIHLEFTTHTNELPSQNLQILLIFNQSILSPRGINTKKEQIIAISTIKISYPLPQQYSTIRLYNFDRTIQSKANFRASFSLIRYQASPRKLNNKKSLHQLQTADKLQDKQQTIDSITFGQKPQEKEKKLQDSVQLSRKSSKRENQQEYEQLVNQRNQLYKMSQNLYQQLKKCMNERDEYLRELRQKQLSEQQIRQQNQFLKLKIQQYDGSQQIQTNHIPIQLQQLKRENQSMKDLLTQKQKQLKELQRRVKQSLIAIDQFRKEAVEARNDLIHKQSQLQLIHKQSKKLDPYQCIQYLQRQLENRQKVEDYELYYEDYKMQLPIQKIVTVLKRQSALLFASLLKKTRQPKEKQWLICQKINFQNKISSFLQQ